jgi:predicted transcriptional regulator
MTSEQSPITEGDTGPDVGPEERFEPREFDIANQEYGIFECTECENVLLTVRSSEADLSCHGEEMVEVTDWAMEINPPDIRNVLLDAFGLPKVGLDICLCVIGEGPLSPSEVAESLDYDESTVSAYLNDLVDIGLLEKSQLNRQSGGYINVYHSIDLARMRRETLVGFYVWAGEAGALLEEANRTKEEYLDEDHSEGLEKVFWETFRDGE